MRSWSLICGLYLTYLDAGGVKLWGGFEAVESRE